MNLQAPSIQVPNSKGLLDHSIPTYGLFHYVWKLLRLRIQLAISEFKRAKTIRKIGLVIIYLLILGFFVFMFYLSWLLLNFLKLVSADPSLFPPSLGSALPFLESMPSLILSVSFMGILFTSFGVLLQALYLAGDMDFLLSAPIPIRAVFVSKLLQAILPNFSLVALLSLPVLFGLGGAGGYNFLYYPLVVIILVLLALAAAGLSSLLVMFIVRIFPARRVAEVLGFFGAIISIICSQSGNFMNAGDFSKTGFPVGDIPYASLANLNNPWSPLSWAGRSLVDIGQGNWIRGGLYLLLTLGLAGTLFIASLKTAERLYYSGWASIQTSTRKKKPVRTKAVKVTDKVNNLAFLEHLVPAPIRGIITKDFLVLRRDLRNLSQLVTPLIVGLMYAIMLLRSGGQAPAGQGEAPEWFMQTLEKIMLYGNVGISLFVGWSLLSRLALMGFSQEGKSYWILKSAPLRNSHILVAKFLVAYLPSLALGWIFMLLISVLQGVNLSILLFGLGVVSLSIAGTAGLNLAFGVVSVRLDWEDPRKMNAGGMGCVSMLVSGIFLVISLGFFFTPPILLPNFGIPEIAGQIIGLMLGGGLNILVAFLAPRLVMNRIPRIGEI
jgi:ABC-2 type transport system permease protein